MIFDDIEIKMFPAGAGDCILIHFFRENFRILIDGGFGETYDRYLKPFLTDLGKRGERLNLVIATHIDRDHINGIKKLLQENGNAAAPNILPIDEIWFNGFRNMPVSRADTKDVPLHIYGILQNMASNNREITEEGSSDISFRDGNCLAELIAENGYAWNKPFSRAAAADDLRSADQTSEDATEDKRANEAAAGQTSDDAAADKEANDAVGQTSGGPAADKGENDAAAGQTSCDAAANKGAEALTKGDGSAVKYGNIHIKVLNPVKKDLDRLAQKWIRELQQNSIEKIVIGENHLFDRAFEGCLLGGDSAGGSFCGNVSMQTAKNVDWDREADREDEKPDRSLQNMTSIAVLIEYGEKRMLFTGDCPMEKIMEHLPEKIDIVKLPHHGSGKSTRKSFILGHKVACYLISTDGRSFGHPSKMILGNILCRAEGKPMIVTNYHLQVLQGTGAITRMEKQT